MSQIEWSPCLRVKLKGIPLPCKGLAWLYMEVRHQNILQQGGSESEFSIEILGFFKKRKNREIMRNKIIALKFKLSCT